MSNLGANVAKLFVMLALACLPALAQQVVPDAPTPKPSAQFPSNAPPAPKNTHTEQQPTDAAPTTPNQTPAAQTQRGTGDVATDIGMLETFRVNVNFVEIPVTVKDSRGTLVEGLGPRDFAVFEDGQLQKLSYFNSQAFPLSAAVVVDIDLPPDSMKKVNESLPALIGAFSEFDEVALYRYGSSVTEVTSFSTATDITDATIQRMKKTNRDGGPAYVGGPIQSVPMINGHPADPGAINPVYTAPPREAHVLNDAILRAANDLAKRSGQARRRIIFVISDGRESKSIANYEEVRRVLQARNITVYAIGVEIAGIPVYDKLNRIRIPGQGYGNVLPRYTNDTAGELHADFNKEAIEQDFAKITELARNRYTLGFNTRVTPASNCHEIVVNVHRPDLTVYARPNYCPLPPQQRP